MAFPASHVNGATLADILMGTEVDLDGDTINVALYTTAATWPDKDAVQSYLPTDEVAAGGDYTAGGSALTGPTVTYSGGKLIFADSAATLAWTGVTFDTEGCVIYSDTADPKRVLCAINFGAVKSVVSGTFTITWDATNGIFYATY